MGVSPRRNTHCLGVIVGPLSHKMTGMGDENSPLTQIRQLNKNVVTTTNGNSAGNAGKLKMTNSSLDEAFKKLAMLILSRDNYEI